MRSLVQAQRTHDFASLVSHYNLCLSHMQNFFQKITKASLQPIR